MPLITAINTRIFTSMHTGTTRRCSVGLLSILWVGVSSSAVNAQPPRPRVVITTTTAAPASRCAELTSSPSMLVQDPEGRALLRFKRELNDAAQAVTQRSDTGRSGDIMRIAQTQRGVDSLMQIVVRYRNPDGTEGETITLRRGDTIPRIVSGRRIAPTLGMWDDLDATDREIRLQTPQVETELRTLRPGLEAAIRSLQPQIAAFSDAARMHMAGKLGAPNGYLGMHLSESKITMIAPEGVQTNYCDYPVIEAVDAGSPAERGGLIAGDTVLAYNGRDVRTQPVNYNEILVPGQSLKLRVKRSGRVRELSVMVAPRPVPDRASGIGPSPCAGMPSCDVPSFFYFGSPRPPMLFGQAGVGIAPGESAVFGTGNGTAQMFGAQLSIVDDDLAQNLGVECGMLVLRVSTGSAAAVAGLRAGDVIRTVNGAPVRDVTALRRAFGTTAGAPGAREAKLTVSTRNSPARTVVVRW